MRVALPTKNRVSRGFRPFWGFWGFWHFWHFLGCQKNEVSLFCVSDMKNKKVTIMIGNAHPSHNLHRFRLVFYTALLKYYA